MEKNRNKITLRIRSFIQILFLSVLFLVVIQLIKASSTDSLKPAEYKTTAKVPVRDSLQFLEKNLNQKMRGITVSTVN